MFNNFLILLNFVWTSLQVPIYLDFIWELLTGSARMHCTDTVLDKIPQNRKKEKEKKKTDWRKWELTGSYLSLLYCELLNWCPLSWDCVTLNGACCSRQISENDLKYKNVPFSHSKTVSGKWEKRGQWGYSNTSVNNLCQIWPKGTNLPCTSCVGDMYRDS